VFYLRLACVSLVSLGRLCPDDKATFTRAPAPTPAADLLAGRRTIRLFPLLACRCASQCKHPRVPWHSFAGISAARLTSPSCYTAWFAVPGVTWLRWGFPASHRAPPPPHPTPPADDYNAPRTLPSPLWFGPERLDGALVVDDVLEPTGCCWQAQKEGTTCDTPVPTHATPSDHVLLMPPATIPLPGNAGVASGWALWAAVPYLFAGVDGTGGRACSKRVY